MSAPIHRGLAPYALGAEAFGWGICGASSAAGRMVTAIRAWTSSPLARRDDSAWAVGVHSHSLWRARHFADRHAIPHAFADLTDLLAQRNVKIVYVGNHPRHHAPTVLAALHAGKHVLCEPPLALTVEEARVLAQAAADRGLTLGVNYQHRADAAIIAMWRLVGSGDMGDLLGGRIRNTLLLPIPQQTWRLEKPGGGVLLDRSLHSLDLLRFLCADEIAEVFAVEGGRIWGAEVEEDVAMIVRMSRRRITCIVHDSFVIPHVATTVDLYGAQLALTASCCREGQESLLFGYRAGEQSSLPVSASAPLPAIVAAMQRAVAGHGEPLATAADAIQSLAAVLAANQSLQRGVSIRV